MPSEYWAAPPAQIALSGGEVHVWRVALDLPTPQVAELERSLAPDERARATAFRFPHLRRRFIVGRGTLRAILGRYLELAPHTLRFIYGAHGKPRLGTEYGPEAPQFNITHADDLALIAVAGHRRVGVDIEARREIPDLTALVKYVCSPLERSALAALSATKRSDAFLHCWTKKEAYLKGVGLGLTVPLHEFSIAVAPDEPVRMFPDDHDGTLPTHWILCTLDLGQGHIGALAVDGHVCHLRCWQLPGVPPASADTVATSAW